MRGPLIASEARLLHHIAIIFIIKRAQMLRPNSGSKGPAPPVKQPWKVQIEHADFPMCRVGAFSYPAPVTMLDQTQKARMAHNREQALRRLHSRQFKGRAHSETAILTTHCSVSQASSLSDIANALYTKKDRFMPLEDTNIIRQDCKLFGNVESGLEVRSTRVSQTRQMVIETSKVNYESQDTLKAQDFDYVVVIDFEATCDKDMNGLKPQEIIEFPAVIVDCRRLTLEDSFQTYVKPVHHPILTDFCRNLTGINQDQVDKGISLAEALYWHDKWLEDNGVKDKKFAILIWSDWDCKTMLESECKLKGLNKPQYFNRWINLKVLFQNVFNGRKCNLRKAVEASGLKWNGRAHCGLDDALNTARLALELIRRGTNLSITGSIDPQPIVTKIRRPEWPGVVVNTQASSGGMFDCTDGNSSLRNATSRNIDLTSVVSTSDMSTIGTSSTGLDSMVCYCGVRCKRRIVRKPGPTCGKFFFSCGRWTIADGDHCSFFEWAVS